MTATEEARERLIVTPEEFRQAQMVDKWNPYDISEYPDIVEKYPDYDKSKPLPDFYQGWRPRDYQLPVLEHLETIGPYDNALATTVWHRRAGKTLTTVKLAAKMAFERVGLILHVFPKLVQGRRIVWRGRGDIMVDGKRVSQAFIDSFPRRYWKSKNNHDMSLELSNGSIYQIAATDGPNLAALIGSNPVGMIMDEYSIQDPQAWEYLAPIITENGGWVWFVYTPRGENHGFDLFNTFKKQMQEKNPNVYCELLTILDTGAISMDKARAIQETTNMTEEKFQQEFMCSWKAALEEAYYAEQMRRCEDEGRITDVPWQPREPVYTAWDLGRNDANAIWYYQILNGGDKVNFIDYDEASRKSMEDHIKKLREKPYMYAKKHAGPHDLKVEEYTTGISRKQFAKNQGIDFEIAPKAISVEEGINAARSLLAKSYFDKKKCRKGINALKSYRSEKDVENGTFKKIPVHDWASNGADSFRYAAVTLNKLARKRLIRSSSDILADWDPFSIII